MLGRCSVGPRQVVIAIRLPSGQQVIDPAVDLDKSDIDKYRESFWDKKHLTYHNGEKPTVFKLQPLTRRQKDAGEVYDSVREKAHWYLRCSLLRVDNYGIERDGNVEYINQPERKESGSFGLMVTEEYLDRLDLPEDILVALLFIVREMSEASLPLSRRSDNQSGRTTSEDSETQTQK